MSAVDVATLRAVLVADTAAYGSGLKKAEMQAQGFERKSTKSFNKVGAAAKTMAKTGGVALGVALAVGVKKSVDAFREQQKVTRQTSAVLKSTGHAADMSKKAIEDLAQSLSKKTGIDDEAIQSMENLMLTFTKVGKKGGVFKKATALALDMSVALGTDTKSAALQLGKALQDPERGLLALRRSGVSFTKAEQEKIKALVASGNQLKAQKMILREVATEFGGSAAAVATPVGQLMVTIENIGERVGGVLVPAIDKGAAALNNFLTPLAEGGGKASEFGTKVSAVFNSIKNAAGGGGLFGKDFTNALATISAEAGPILNNLAKIFRWVFNGVIMPVVKRSLPGVIQMFQGFFRTLSGVVKLISGLLSGDFRKMWAGIKLIFSGAIKTLIGIVRHSTAAMRAVAAAVARGFVAGLKAAPGAALGAGKWLINRAIAGVKSLGSKLVSIGKWITDQIRKGLGKLVPKISIPKIDLNPFSGGKGGGNVGPLGNDKGSLGAAGKLAASFGNQVTSGYRPGDPGWHGKNRARDYAGGNMMGFAKAAATKFGGRLLELIHTPLGYGIKNGRKVPLSYWGSAVNADHFDHVHVAMRRGGKAGPNQGGPSVVYGEGKKTEWWVSQEGNRQKNIGYAMEALTSLTGNRMKMFKDGGKVGPGGLKGLWTQAGGASKIASLMAAIAMGESGGNPKSVNYNTNGTVDKGLWQINSVHGYKGNMFNPLTNARAAVKIYKKQGLGAWVAYTNGSYKKFLAAARRAKGGKAGAAPKVPPTLGGGFDGMGSSQAVRSGKGLTSFNSFQGSGVGAALGGSVPGAAGAAVKAGGDGWSPIEPGSGEGSGEDPAVLLAQIRDELRKISANSDATRNVVRGEIEQGVLDFFNKGIGGRLAGGSRLASAGVNY